MKRKWIIEAPAATIFVFLAHQIVSSHSQIQFDPGSVASVEKETIELLEKHAKKLSIEKFYNDPILVQSVSNGTLSYKCLQSKKVVITNDKLNDVGREVIVVGSDENKFAIPTPRKGKRRQFLLLKKSTSQKGVEIGVEYHVSFIYLRDFLPNETYTETLTVGGMKSVPEFDIWEHRPTKFYPGWGNCDFSVMFTCTSLRALSEDVKKKKKGLRKEQDIRNTTEEKHLRKKRASEASQPHELLSFHLLDGHDPRFLNDLYHDYDYHRFKLEGEVDDFEKKELDKIEEEQKTIKEESGHNNTEDSWKGEVNNDELSEDDKALNEDLSKLEEEQRNHEKHKYKFDDVDKNDKNDRNDTNDTRNWEENGVGADVENDEDKNDMNDANNTRNWEENGVGADGGNDEDNTDSFNERSGLLPDVIFTRKKRETVDEKEEIGRKNKKKLQDILRAVNESEVGAHLYVTPTGLKPAPGLKWILLVGDSEKELKSLLDGFKVNDGILVLKVGSDSPGEVVKKGILIPNEHSEGYRWAGGSKNEDLGSDDEIEVPDNSGVLSWDRVNFNSIEIVVPHLLKAGFSRHEARLAGLGSQITDNAQNLVTEIHAVKWRLGTDTVGTALNGGPYRGKGFKGNDSFPSNAEITFGTTFSGAGVSGQVFFFPWSSLTRAVYKFGNISIPGYFMPSLPGAADAFHPDDEKTAQEVYDMRGKIIPVGFQEENEDLGIWGYLRQGYIFNAEVPKLKALYDPTAPEWNSSGDEAWVPESNGKCPERPRTTKDGKKILYGHIYPGMVESPHIFIADGDSLSGYFTLFDDNLSEQEGTVHGVLTPLILGGHAIFFADALHEVDYLQETRGVFTPDTMGYGGGISGRISRTDVSPQKYIFHLDRPAVEFMYIEGYPDAQDVWSPYLKPGQWKWFFPSLDNEEGNSTSNSSEPEDKQKSPEHRIGDNEDVDDDERTISSYGTKVIARKTEVLIPIDFEISGTLILVPHNTSSKMKAFDVDVVGNKPDFPMQCTIYFNRSVSEEPVPEIQMRSYNGAAGIFIPDNFPKGDAILAKYRYGELRLTQTYKSHFWDIHQPIWTPLGYVEKMEASGGDKGGDDINEEAEKVEEEVKNNFAPNASRRGVPGVVTKAREQPKKITNYKFGSLYDSESAEMTDTYSELGLLSHEYSFGYFLKFKESPYPIFIPESGVIGTFTPDDASQPPEQVYFFPPRENFTAKFILKHGFKESNDKVKGRFQPKYKRPMAGFMPVIMDKGSLTPIGEPDVITGWRQLDVPLLKKSTMPKGWKNLMEPGQIRPTKKSLKYAVIELGGGYRCVVVQGAESIDDPNNPILQQYLHYKAIRDGDVNPFGVVNIVDPIKREVIPPIEKNVSDAEKGIFGGITKLGRGRFVEEIHNPGSMANEVMKQFSVRHWEYKKIGEVTSNSGVKRQALRLGKQENVVNMMDFRMFLFKRYTLKRARFNNAWARIYIPFGSEPFLSVKKKARPAESWIKNMVTSGTTCSLLCKSTSLNFAIHFQIDPDEIIKFERPAGEDVPSFKDIETVAHSDNDALAAVVGWGDDTVCDEILLGPFQVAQLSVGMMKNRGATGVDLGYLIVSNIGQELKFSKVMKKILETMDDMSREKEEKFKVPPMGPQITDVLGDKKAEVEKRIDATDDDDEEEEKPAEEVTPRPSKKMKGRTFTLKEQERSKAHAQVLVGWKTQWRNITENVTIGNKGLVFYGLGNCEQKEVPDVKQWASEKPMKVLKYYLKVLRINCMENAKQRMINLINEGYLEMDGETKYFRIPWELKVIRMLRATPAELKKLSIAFEFHTFTKIYSTMRQKTIQEPIIKEPYCNITRDLQFLTEMTLYTISRAPRMIPAHSVRIVRNLLATLRTVMTKLYQDSIILNECDTCTLDKELNSGDQFRLTCLIEFIIHGLGPYESGELMLRPAFRKFVHMNVDALRQRVLEFGRQFPRTPPVIHVPLES